MNSFVIGELRATIQQLEKRTSIDQFAIEELRQKIKCLEGKVKTERFINFIAFTTLAILIVAF